MVDPTPRPPGAPDLRELSTAILGAVEQQLSRYFSAASARIDQVERQLQAQSATPPTAVTTGLDRETMLEVRQAVRDDFQQVLSDLQGRVEHLRQADVQLAEQINTLGLRVVTTADGLVQRIEAGGAQASQHLDARFDTLQRSLGATVEDVRARVEDRSTLLQSRIDAVDSGATDRVLALEQRLKEDLGSKMAALEASVGRAASGFDEAMTALSQRLSEMEARVIEMEETLISVSEAVSRVDANAIESVRRDTAAARNDVEVVRASLAHTESTLTEQVDATTRRMQEMEVEFAAAMDVSTAVQLERLDEIERQVTLLGPPISRTFAPPPPPPAT